MGNYPDPSGPNESFIRFYADRIRLARTLFCENIEVLSLQSGSFPPAHCHQYRLPRFVRGDRHHAGGQDRDDPPGELRLIENLEWWNVNESDQGFSIPQSVEVERAVEEHIAEVAPCIVRR